MKNKRLKLILSIVLVFVFIISGYFLISQPVSKSKPDSGIVSFGGQNINVELAVTPESQMRGLSGRFSLPDNTGMLFVFDKPGKYKFWMNEMNFPIDIIWISSDFKILYIEKNLTPETYPNKYGPDADSKLVLEVPAGFADKNMVKIGDEIFVSIPTSK